MSAEQQAEFKIHVSLDAAHLPAMRVTLHIFAISWDGRILHSPEDSN